MAASPRAPASGRSRGHHRLRVVEATADAVRELADQSLWGPAASRARRRGGGILSAGERGDAGSIDALGLNGAPYFLWTGSLNPRKNLRNVVRAFDLVAQRLPHHLVLAGGSGVGSRGCPRRDLEREPDARQRIHRPGYVSDASLRALYRGATAFLYVSLLEGFGLPILEAMASGCPVVTSNASCMPEIAGTAAMLVDPRQPEEIADAMLRLAGNKRLHQDFKSVAGNARRSSVGSAAHGRWRRSIES